MQQNYANHRRSVPVYHRVLLPLLLMTHLGSLVNLYQSLGNHDRVYNASLIAVIVICMMVLTIYARIFALKAQDRAIRAEENLRHYVLTGKLLDSRLTARQIVGLRFAGDDEFAELARTAAEQGTSEDDIKKSVKNWRPDFYRV